MAYTCKECKYGLERSPDGQRPRSGTVWCSKRKIAMGHNRRVSCFVPLIAGLSKGCQDCRRAKKYLPTGGSPSLGKVWCDRRNAEINRMRTMDCFE